jgi:hypothetical protein
MSAASAVAKLSSGVSRIKQIATDKIKGDSGKQKHFSNVHELNLVR